MSKSPRSTASRGSAKELIAEGRAELRSGNHEASVEIADRLLTHFADTPDSLLFAGEAHFARGNFARARQIAADCAARFPADAGGPVLQCRSLLALGRIAEARDLALGLSARDITVDAHFEILVAVLSGCMETAAAYRLCRKSVHLDPDNPAAYRRLALTCRLIGKSGEAADAADACLRFDPHDYAMISLRSTVQKATAADNHVAELEKLIKSGCRSALGAARVAYALAREYEDLELHERAFDYVDAGARFKRLTLNYDLRRELQTQRLLQQYHDAAALGVETAGFDSAEPIFILGLPRTGSSLVERVLSSHSAIHSAGELLHLNAAMMEAVRKHGPVSSRADLIRKCIEADPAALGRNYLERTRPFTGHTAHFIDKQPLNYLSIGVICRALPNARIIHVLRTPMDTCFAIYKFLFNDAYPWSYDLEDIARYYIGYRQLMDHWRGILPPGRLIEVAYEDVVFDLEGQARSLVSRLGLPWEDACLSFHASDAATFTGSATQVRRKVYASSVGCWRHHERRLENVAHLLSAAGIDPYRP